jgi:nucleotidyltransferase/DNA polymerase involved in DNA repair
MSRTILHVDMDAFFAAIEQRDHLEWRGKPVIVGADPKAGKGRGIVATCSYEARKFGVHSAQPISRAWRLCPQGIFTRPDMARYGAASERIMAIFLEFTDLVEQVSVDEAFLDVSGSRRLFGTGREIAKKIKLRIHEDQRLTASVGIASNKFVAKVASDLEKPDGLVEVEPGMEREFLRDLPLRRLWGVGAKTEALLLEQGISRIGHLLEIGSDELTRRIGPGHTEHLCQLARGIDDRPVSPEEGYKSIGHETTFEVDTIDPKFLHDTVLALSERVAQRLRSNLVRARTITLKFREADFSTYTRRVTLGDAVDTADRIFPVAQRLLQSLVRERVAVRLVGVYGSNLVSEKEGQLGLFASKRSKDRELAAAVDDISRRFGDGAITRAALVPRKKSGSRI